MKRTHPRTIETACVACGRAFTTHGTKPRKTCSSACRLARCRDTARPENLLTRVKP